ncbi:MULTISPECIES: glycosyltransferase family 25 protein [unclassified Neisseria]|uniref:glycosyltransferase family 25 protein n=1 Tax=unclassified Neisseria TaxID=2623750 RepID=UPI00266689A6|nr:MULTISPECIES: glycosyltransferase family 25 protein [unclassified Neisseria]MDO1509441.1 glycosyltransferase family 25 protein [Neisseria sp. MVDL19-042950]MDO1515786.1 glycosyltransferase family 25 protein [Neisseria sp. MVDL18-041461]MDO1563390.1 glycosyltransferase family 25 protein [Neisseria sp. MVDL20-010259]
MLTNYVISIKTAIERRRHLQQQFAQQNIPFTFFDALTPSETLDQAIRRHLPNLAHADHLTSGEKACFMSHVLLWQKCIDENLPYIAVYEDDVLLGENAACFLRDASWLDKRFSSEHTFIVRLETSLLPSVYYPCPAVLPHVNRHFSLLGSTQWGTAGYIISFKAAQLLLQVLPTFTDEELKAIDILMFGTLILRPDLLICQMEPALCIQEDKYNEKITLHSQLEQDRKEKHIALHAEPPVPAPPKKSWKQRLIHALTKISREREKYRQRIIDEYIAECGDILKQHEDSRKKIVPFQ